MAAGAAAERQDDQAEEWAVKLNARQQRFVDEYLVDLNATQAAIRAGYSRHTARMIGSENLTKPDIASAIQEALQERSARTQITADRVLRELARIAFFDIRRLLDDNGEPLPLQDLDDDTAAGIAGLETATERGQRDSDGNEAPATHIRKYRIADKNAALTNAMRHLGMLRDRVEMNGTITLTDLLKQAAARRGQP